MYLEQFRQVVFFISGLLVMWVGIRAMCREMIHYGDASRNHEWCQRNAPKILPAAQAADVLVVESVEFASATCWFEHRVTVYGGVVMFGLGLIMYSLGGLDGWHW